MGKTIIGYQLADERGQSIQGDDIDPTGLSSFEVMDRRLALAVATRYPAFHLRPVYEGDIEEPSVVSGVPESIET